MMKLSFAILACTALLPRYVATDPTWPSSIDELEDIMFLLSGYRKRGFADAVTPCSFSAAGNGRISAAEWIRTAFHDMAPANIFFGTGGLDASIMFELDKGESPGAGFNSSLGFFSHYFSSRASMADLIALSMYTATRSCGGPIVKVRAGRIDAQAAGPLGVPQPQNSVGTFQNQFARLGFSTADMIAATACGHTLGGVHAEDFPQIVPVGSAPNNFQHFDSTTAFDERIAVEYVLGNTTDPLVVGPSIAVGRDSDGRIFGADGNVTIKALTDPATFASTCASILQRMIEVVPGGVVLTDPVEPYEVKPTALQLTLLSGGSSITFAGYIRVRTTVRPMTQIASVQLLYKDRDGGSNCGSCTINTAVAGTTTGFDDNFVFYAFSSDLPSISSISSFNVTITLTTGGTELYDNNGVGYPVQDAVMLQTPQSCLDPTVEANGTNNLTVVAAVRSGRPSASLDLSLKVPRQGVIVPALQNLSIAMVQRSTVGPYDIYSVSYAIDHTQNTTTTFDVSSGTGSSRVADAFKATLNLPSACGPDLSPGSSSTTSSISSSTSSSSTSSVKSSSTSSTISSSASKSSSTSSTSSSSTKSSSTSSTKSSSTSSTLSSSTSETSSTSSKSSSKSSTSSTKSSSTSSKLSSSTSETSSTSSMSSSKSSTSSTSTSSTKSSSISSTSSKSSSASSSWSSKSSTTSSSSSKVSTTAVSSSSATPTQTSPAVKPAIGAYTYYGCQTEGTNGRALSAASAYSDTMTEELCVSYCNGFTYAGVEYGRECYCGNLLDTSSIVAPEGDCSFLCPGNNLEYCGANNRLNVYSLTATATATSSATPSQTAPAIKPTIGSYSYYGCQTEGTNSRALSAASAFSDTMTEELCVSYCNGFTYAGVEYGRECYCGNQFTTGSVVAPAGDCSFLCPGNNLEYCGAGNRLTVYTSG